MILDNYREDLEKQKSGAPIHIDDATFFVKRLGTPEATKAIKKISYSLFGPLHKYTEEDDYQKIAHVLAEYAVVGWEGVYAKEIDKKEKIEFEYNEENKYILFLSEEFRLSINLLIWNEAWKFENYLHDEAEEAIDEIKKF